MMRQWLGTGFLALVLLTSYLVVLDGLMRPVKQSRLITQIEQSQNEQLSEPLLLPSVVSASPRAGLPPTQHPPRKPGDSEAVIAK